MRFNFISETSDGFGFAYRIQEEGNDVRLWIRDAAATSVGDGFVPKCGDIEDLLLDASRQDDVYVFDGSGNGIIADRIRSMGFGVVGGSGMADRLEKDRGFAMEVMKGCRIDIPETKSFSSFDDGIEHTKATKERMVYKPSKHLGELSPSLVTYDQGDLIELLEGLKETVDIDKPEFDLQVFTKGLEISTEGWFDGDRFLPLFNHTFERKQLMNENLGPSGGCTGNIVWACDGECPVCRKGIRKMESFLRRESYQGMIDLNAILADERLYGLEFTPRFGYDASPTLLCSLLDMEIGQLLADTAKGQMNERYPLRLDTYAGAVRITIPPWPTEKHNASSDVPIRGLAGNDYDSVYWYNVKQGKRDTKFVSSGAWGILCIFMGVGDTVAKAMRKPERLAEQVRVPDKQYRTDLTEQFKASMVDLESLAVSFIK